MFIYTAAQMKKVDEHTVEVQQISSWELMERAAQAVVKKLLLRFSEERPFVLICGKGNNGGDGLAIARMLYKAQRKVLVYLLEDNKYSKDNFHNQKLLSDLAVPIHFFRKQDRWRIPDVAIVIDCLFGYGLQHTLDQDWQPLVDMINTAATIVSVDLPSGLLTDEHTPETAPVVHADYTYTFHAPKIALLFPENQERVGSMKVIDIQLAADVVNREELPYEYISPEMLQKHWKSREHFSHKGTYGHVLVAGGSYGKIGSIVLSSKAALRAGCGLVTAYVPQCGYNIMQTAFPEAMVLTDAGLDCITDLPGAKKYAAIAIGMGIGQEHETVAALAKWLRDEYAVMPPLVIDADGLNILSMQQGLLGTVPDNTILTPHPKELERLIGTWDNDFDKWERTRVLAQQYKLIVMIKGAHTAIVLPDGRTYFNSSGNPGMATAGSGDVLSGIITGLLAQGYTPEEAATMGVWVHGRAGDLARRDLGMESLIASDLIAYLPKALMELHPKG